MVAVYRSLSGSISETVTANPAVPGVDQTGTALRIQVARTDTNGLYTFDLPCNDEVSPPGIYWTIHEPGGNELTVFVPASTVTVPPGGWQVDAIRVDDPQEPGQIVVGGSVDFTDESSGAITIQAVTTTTVGSTVESRDVAPWLHAAYHQPGNALDIWTGMTTQQQATARTAIGGAPLASPALTGNPTAPTQTAGDNTTRLATTAFATAAIAAQAATDSATYVHKNRPFFDPLDYGATFDGTTSDSAGINAAFTAAVAEGGGTVLLGQKFRLTTTVTVPPQCHLEGFGSDLDGTAAASVGTAATGIGTAIIIASPGRKNRLRGFTLKSDNASVGTDVGIMCQASRAQLTDVTVSSFGGHNLYWYTPSGSGANANVPNLQSVRSERSGSWGMWIEGTDCNAGFMWACDFVGNHKGGIRNLNAKWVIKAHFSANSVYTGIQTGQGNYATLTAYNIGDAVFYNNDWYVALVAIPNTNTTPPAIGSSWAVGGVAIQDEGNTNDYEPYIEGNNGARIVLGVGSSYGRLWTGSYAPGALDYSLNSGAMASWDVVNYGTHRDHVRIADRASNGNDSNVWQFSAGATTPGLFELRDILTNAQIALINNNGATVDLWQWNQTQIPRVDSAVDLGQLAKRFGNLFVASSIQWGSAKPIWLIGAGAPEGVVTGRIGSLYLQTDGTTDATMWRKETGTGNTGWVPSIASYWSQSFFKKGALALSTGQLKIYAERAMTIVSVRASVGTAPASTPVICDINLNGSTIFSTQANRPTIAAAGVTSGAVTNMNTTSVAVGDYFTVDVDQIDAAAADLTVQIRCK